MQGIFKDKILSSQISSGKHPVVLKLRSKDSVESMACLIFSINASVMQFSTDMTGSFIHAAHRQCSASTFSKSLLSGAFLLISWVKLEMISPASLALLKWLLNDQCR